MLRYFILRPEQQLFCYLYGIALALVLMVLFSPASRAGGFYLVALSVALLWAGLALYTRHTDRMRRPEVSPQVGIRDGIQVVAILPRHEKARLEWEILQDADVYRRQMVALIINVNRFNIQTKAGEYARRRPVAGVFHNDVLPGAQQQR